MKQNDMIVCDNCKSLDKTARQVHVNIYLRARTNPLKKSVPPYTGGAVLIQPSDRLELDLCDVCAAELRHDILEGMKTYGGK